ncbi:MAG TPA: glycine betaine ABC transporter substrate-binding protein [Methyloceanibacter sp.]|jgi:glycine betaine/proline transport system substrate-binding protein
MASAAVTMLMATLPVFAIAEDRMIRLGQVGLSFYAVVGGIVQDVLEKDGYTVEVTAGSHGDIFPKLGAGEVDILAAAWLPDGHAPLYAKVKAATFIIGELYHDARLYWAVPDYVPADLVHSVDDLKKPEVAARMDKRIRGIGATSGLMLGAAKIHEAYGLDTVGYEVIPGEPKDWVDNFKQAVSEERWLVMPLWQPQWINAAYKVRVLEEPKGIYGKGDTAVLLGHETLKSKLSPETLYRLANIKLSVAAVTQMDLWVNVDGLTPREAAKKWLSANPPN